MLKFCKKYLFPHIKICYISLTLFFGPDPFHLNFQWTLCIELVMPLAENIVYSELLLCQFYSFWSKVYFNDSLTVYYRDFLRKKIVDIFFGTYKYFFMRGPKILRGLKFVRRPRTLLQTMNISDMDKSWTSLLVKTYDYHSDRNWQKSHEKVTGKWLLPLIYPLMFKVKAIWGGGQGKKKSCLVISKDLNEFETLLFTECQNSILVKSYCNFNFGNLVGSLINLRTKMKF